MDWSKLVLHRRRFLRTLGVAAFSLYTGKALAKEINPMATLQSARTNKVMPTIYIPHGGGPCFFMEWTMGPRDTWDGMGAWLKQLASTLPERPKAILVISAHWEESVVTINVAEKPHLLYDYYGFPPETYEIKYGAPGSPELAEKVRGMLTSANIKSNTDHVRGLDHGVFVPLKLIYPKADIPVVQLSLRNDLDPARHIELGRALAPLRKEGVLIVGSGMSYHNLGRSGPDNEQVATVFDNWLNEVACHNDSQERVQLLKDWEKAPSARKAHPREEHLIPLMVAVGAAGTDLGKRTFSQRVGKMAISAFQFG